MLNQEPYTSGGRPAAEARPGAGEAVAGPRVEGEMTWRRAAVAIAVGLALILLVALAIRYLEMVTGQYVSHGVPPLPAFAAVLVLSLLRHFLRRRFPRLAPTRGQILLIYAMLTIGVVLNGGYHVRAFLPHLTALQYLGQDGSGGGSRYADYARYLPAWYAPHGEEVIRGYYEGTRSGAIPWDVWLRPVLWWSLFFTAVFLGVFSLVHLIHRQWIRDEKLAFPLLTLPLAMTAEDWSAYGSRAGRRALFVAGFAIPAVFNGLNILHALYPSVPEGMGFYVSLADYFPNRPWTPLQSVILFQMPEAIGIGYFVPLDVSFSTWVFYLMHRAIAVGGTAAGYDQPSFPFVQDMGAGAYIAVGLMLLWGLRRAFKESLRRAFPGEDRGRRPDLGERWAWIGLAGSMVFVLGFCRAAGFSLWLAAPYFAIIGLFVVVYARMRAETGVPFGFMYPYGLPKEMLLNAVTIPQALAWAGPQSLVLFSSMAWISRHHYAMEQAANQMDSAKLAEEGAIPRRTLFVALLLAFAVGLAAAFWVHLSTYYDIGSNMAGGGTGAGGGEPRAAVARNEYEQMAGQLSSPPLQNTGRIVAAAGGFCFAGALTWLRTHWIGLPLHPLGFLLATSWGDTSTAWFPLLVAWVLKAGILYIGGLKLYRQGIPFFLGLTIGHFFVAGVFWPVLSLLISKEASSAYHVYFGF